MKNNEATEVILKKNLEKFRSREYRTKISSLLINCVELINFRKALSKPQILKTEVNSAIEKLFSDMHWVKNLFQDMRHDFNASDVYLTPLQAANNKVFRGVMLFDDYLCKIILSTVEKRSFDKHKSETQNNKSVVFESYDTFCVFNSPSPIRVTIWECPEYDGETDFRDFGFCKQTNSIEFTGYRVFHLRGGKQSLVIEELGESTTILMARNGVDPSAYSLEYDSKSLSLLKHLSSDNTAPWLKFAFSFLKETSRVDAISLIEKYLDHQSHDVRWAAVTEILGLGGSPALLERLSEMSHSDPNEEIKELSSQTLKLISETV